MSSSIVLAGASSIGPPRAESTIAFAVSCSPGPQLTSTAAPVSAVRRVARAMKRSAGRRKDELDIEELEAIERLNRTRRTAR